MVKQWRPEMKKDFLPGPRAGKMAVWAVGSAVAFVVYAVLLFGGMAISGVGYGESWVLTVLFVIWCAGGVLTIAVNIALYYWAIPREVRAGYTTGYRIHQEVDYVDPSTGYVLRVAREPFLELEELSRRETVVNRLIAGEEAAQENGPV